MTNPPEDVSLNKPRNMKIIKYLDCLEKDLKEKKTVSIKVHQYPRWYSSDSEHKRVTTSFLGLDGMFCREFSYGIQVTDSISGTISTYKPAKNKLSQQQLAEWPDSVHVFKRLNINNVLIWQKRQGFIVDPERKGSQADQNTGSEADSGLAGATELLTLDDAKESTDDNLPLNFSWADCDPDDMGSHGGYGDAPEPLRLSEWKEAEAMRCSLEGLMRDQSDAGPGPVCVASFVDLHYLWLNVLKSEQATRITDDSLHSKKWQLMVGCNCSAEEVLMCVADYVDQKTLDRDALALTHQLMGALSQVAMEDFTARYLIKRLERDQHTSLMAALEELLTPLSLNSWFSETAADNEGIRYVQCISPDGKTSANVELILPPGAVASNQFQPMKIEAAPVGVEGDDSVSHESFLRGVLTAAERLLQSLDPQGGGEWIIMGHSSDEENIYQVCRGMNARLSKKHRNVWREGMFFFCITQQVVKYAKCLRDGDSRARTTNIEAMSDYYGVVYAVCRSIRDRSFKPPAVILLPVHKSDVSIISIDDAQSNSHYKYRLPSQACIKEVAAKNPRAPSLPGPSVTVKDTIDGPVALLSYAVSLLKDGEVKTNVAGFAGSFNLTEMENNDPRIFQNRIIRAPQKLRLDLCIDRRPITDKNGEQLFEFFFTERTLKVWPSIQEMAETNDPMRPSPLLELGPEEFIFDSQGNFAAPSTTATTIQAFEYPVLFNATLAKMIQKTKRATLVYSLNDMDGTTVRSGPNLPIGDSG
jgi:hypothetical protein